MRVLVHESTPHEATPEVSGSREDPSNKGEKSPRADHSGRRGHALPIDPDACKAPTPGDAAPHDDGFSPLLAHPDCPRRPPSWRWLRANRIADGKIKASRRLDDGWVADAVRLALVLGRCRDEVDREALRERMPEAFAAHAVFADPNPLRRWSLEAMILSGMSCAAIAAGHRIAEGAVEAYEKTYFDVLDRLDSDFTLAVVIGLRGGPAPPLGTVWKYFAYHGGPAVLDFLMGMGPGDDRAGSPAGFDDFARDEARDGLLRKVAIAALTLPVDARSATKLLDLYLRGLSDRRIA